MPTGDPYTLNLDGWIISVRQPELSQPQEDQRLLLMLHGWTGDEHSMWFFARAVPEYYWLVAPRGIFKSDHEGYSWRPVIPGKFAGIDDFRDSVQKLAGLLNNLADQFKFSFKPIDLIGFSQGAALALSFLILKSEMVRKVACLSGFLPESAEALIKPGIFTGKQILITHGTEDNIVPVKSGRHAAEMLQPSGAEISYCEDKIGHKVSSGCLKSVEKFFNETELT